MMHFSTVEYFNTLEDPPMLNTAVAQPWFIVNPLEEKQQAKETRSTTAAQEKITYAEQGDVPDDADWTDDFVGNHCKDGEGISAGKESVDDGYWVCVSREFPRDNNKTHPIKPTEGGSRGAEKRRDARGVRRRDRWASRCRYKLQLEMVDELDKVVEKLRALKTNPPPSTCPAGELRSEQSPQPKQPACGLAGSEPALCDGEDGLEKSIDSMLVRLSQPSAG